MNFRLISDTTISFPLCQSQGHLTPYWIYNCHMSSTGKIAVGERRGYFTGRRTPSEEGRRTTKCKCSLFYSRLLGVSVICWRGQHYLVFGPFQQIKANRKQTQVKLTAGKQCIRRSSFGVLPLHRQQQHTKEKSNLHAKEDTEELTSVKSAVPGDASSFCKQQFGPEIKKRQI